MQQMRERDLAVSRRRRRRRIEAERYLSGSKSRRKERKESPPAGVAIPPPFPPFLLSGETEGRAETSGFIEPVTT